MISNDYVFVKSYPCFDLYDRIKNGKKIYSECFSNIVTLRKLNNRNEWSHEEETFLLSEIAQGKMNNEIMREYKGERTDGALGLKLTNLRRKIREEIERETC